MHNYSQEHSSNSGVKRWWQFLWAFLNNVAGIIAVALFLNNYFGAALLGVTGAVLVVRGKAFNDFGWLSGGPAKLFGLTWLIAGIVFAVLLTI